MESVQKGKGREFTRETALEGQGRRETRFTASFLARPSCFPDLLRPKSPFLPFGTSDTQARLSLKQEQGMLFICNIEILVKPSEYFDSIFVTFLSRQCGLLQCEIKAFNKSQCLTVWTITERKKKVAIIHLMSDPKGNS